MTAVGPDILVTGATGFIGTAVLRELAGRGMGARVRVLARRPVPGWMTQAGVTTWPGDLTDAASLAGLCTGITTLLHLASQVGGDPARCRAVNEGGTAKLLAEARRAGTEKVLYLSTCAVYRDGVHRGAAVPGTGPAGDRGSRIRGSGPVGMRQGSGSGLVVDLGPSAGRSGSVVVRQRCGAAADLGPSTSRNRSPDERLPNGPEPSTGRNLAGEHRHVKPGVAVAPGGSTGRSGSAGDTSTRRNEPSGERPRDPATTGAELVTDPASPTSRSRLAGERLVLAAGGTVLRPHLVHGPGDRHVVPALVRWVRAVPAWAAGGVARTSLVAVADLAAAIAVLALSPRLSRAGEVLHVADPRPVRMRRLVTAVCELLDLPVPLADLPLAEHHARTRAALPSLTDHQYSLLTRDHWYDSDRIWHLTGVSPGPGFGPRLTEAADWYRESLA